MHPDRLELEMKVHGFCVIEEVIPAACCEEVEARVLEAARRQCRPGTAPENVSFCAGIINHEQSFAPYLAEPRLLQIVTSLLGHDVRVSFTSAIVNEPGNARGDWHADWPFNQRNAGHVPAPYPDATMHLTTLWMLSPFTADNGGTLVVPGSHRSSTNPTARMGVEPARDLSAQMQVMGPAGSVLVFDSRLWHATAPNQSSVPRVALAVRYAPWWLNLDVLRPNSDERRRMVDEPGRSDNQVPAIRREVYEGLPANVRPLYRHWVET